MQGCKTTPPSRRTTWHRAERSCRRLPHGQQMRATGKQQQLGYWSRAGPYAPSLPCSSSKVDSLPQCSGDQRVEKMGCIRRAGGGLWHQHKLYQSLNFSVTYQSGIVGAGEPALSCLPIYCMPPAISPEVTRSAVYTRRSPLPASVACWDHTRSWLILVLEQSEPDGMPDQCPHMSTKNR